MSRYGPAKRIGCGWVKVGTDGRGRKHFFLAQYPWHLEKHAYRKHAHYWEDVRGGKICQQMVHSTVHILPPGYDAGDPSDWTEAAMREWFDRVLQEYDTVREAIFFHENGDMYEGSVNADNEPHGFGTYTNGQGAKYVGQFVNGKRAGIS